jgi:hypothetical protein
MTMPDPTPAVLPDARARVEAFANKGPFTWRADDGSTDFNAMRADLRTMLAAPSVPATAKDRLIAAMRDYISSAGVPITEFDPEFVVRMMAAMMVSFHKYGRVADAYPLKFSAADDVRARMSKYRTTGNKNYLVDAANFAMIEAMHPGRKHGAEWGSNDAADSPGRTTASGHRLVQETNDGTRIMGETILHIPGDEA